MKPTAGRPRHYNKDKAGLDVFEKNINDYFDYCDKEEIPYTISGLAYYLGMSRRSLIDYSGQEEFSRSIELAKLRVEKSIEEKSLSGKYNSNFAIFNLKNNFYWKDKQELDTTHGVKEGQNGKITIEVIKNNETE